MNYKTILLIDDDQLTRKTFKLLFADTDFFLVCAKNSIVGLAQFKSKDFDLVLLDIIMPDLNNIQSEIAGLELLKIFKKIKPDIPVIMNSVITEIETGVSAMKYGAHDYIPKDSLSKAEIINKINETIKKNQLSIIKNKEKMIFTLLSNGENHLLEFKSSLRWDLRKKITSREIEFSWLKTIVAFMNSEGGELLIGADDDANIVGITNDNFKNEDKYLLHFTNLVNQYIGLEFSKFIYFELINIENEKVLYVKCEVTKNPVLLKKNGKEEFYIRVGPSSRKLSPSKMLDYLKNN